MLLSHAEVQAALACPVEVTGGAVVCRPRRDVCGHPKITSRILEGGPDELKVVACVGCGHFWWEHGIYGPRPRAAVPRRRREARP